jgi:hypothetical protein
VKKLTVGFDNGLGAVLIGEHGLASLLSKKSEKAFRDFFNSIGQKPSATLVPQRRLSPSGQSRYCCKKILGIQGSNIDSRSARDAQG